MSNAEAIIYSIMKISQFTIISPYKNDDVLLYNTFSTSFVKLPKQLWGEIKHSVYKNNVENDIKDSPLSETIKKLIEGGFIVSKDKNELLPIMHRYYSKMFHGRSLNLSIAPTMKCNFNCFYCFEEGNKNYGLMSCSVADKLIEYIDSQKDKYITLHWFGGEPLLGFNRIKYICDQLNERGVKYISTIITNGSLLSKRIISELESLHLQYIQISLDGIAKDHDCRRAFKNGKPSFDLIISNLRNLMAMTKTPVCIHVTVDHTNESAYKDIVEFMESNFPEYVKSKRITIGHNYVQNRTGFDSSGSCFTPKQILNDEISNLRYNSGTAKKPTLPGLVSPCMFRCRGSYAVDSKGFIYQCLEHLGNPQFKIGSIVEGKIFKSKLIETSCSHLPFEDEQCRKCSFLPICGGGCAVDRIKFKNGLIKSCCSVHKEKLESLLPHFYEINYKSR